jgi:NAD+ kinase
MKALLFGKNREEVLDMAKHCGFEVVEENPEFIISYGGDGTVMRSEAEFPGVPKIILRDSHVCKLCSPLENREVLELVAKGQYRLDTYWKIEAAANGKTLLAINDVIVHNGDPRHAIRYHLFIDGRKVKHEVIGDGVVAATPFGSSGYYRSITDSFFEVGLGLAFNNSTEPSDHMVLGENSVIELEVTRGPAVVFADNQEAMIELATGDQVTIKKSGQTAKIVRAG